MNNRTLPFTTTKTTRTPKPRPSVPGIVIPMPVRPVDARAAHTALVLALAAGIADANPDLNAAEATDWAAEMLSDMRDEDRPSAAELLALVSTAQPKH